MDATLIFPEFLGQLLDLDPEGHEVAQIRHMLIDFSKDESTVVSSPFKVEGVEGHGV